MKRINKYIGDHRLLEILNKFLKAGYIEPKTGDLVQPEIGTPQGGVLSPLLCNIVLHELDKYMADTEIKFSKGKTRKINPVYQSLANKRCSSIDPVERLNLLTEMRKTHKSLMADPNYRRLDYIRYADDFIVLVTGSFKDAKYIQNNIKEYIKANCVLELNQNKTVISNILNNEWSFLGAKMKKLKINPEWRVKHVSVALQASHVGSAKLLVNAPIDKLLGILKKSGFVRQNKLGKFIPKAYTSIINLTHYDIVSFYNSKIKGIINFYNFASNRPALASIL
jgi:Type II intron maturase/Reverse transcriptase (RNA-dependent DNA polymerase)